MSALPPKADMCSALADVRFGPKADMQVVEISTPGTPLVRGRSSVQSTPAAPEMLSQLCMRCRSLDFLASGWRRPKRGAWVRFGRG